MPGLPYSSEMAYPQLGAEGWNIRDNAAPGRVLTALLLHYLPPRVVLGDTVCTTLSRRVPPLVWLAENPILWPLPHATLALGEAVPRLEMVA